MHLDIQGFGRTATKCESKNTSKACCLWFSYVVFLESRRLSSSWSEVWVVLQWWIMCVKAPLTSWPPVPVEPLTSYWASHEDAGSSLLNGCVVCMWCCIYECLFWGCFMYIFLVCADPLVFGAQAVGSWGTVWTFRSFPCCTCEYIHFCRLTEPVQCLILFCKRHYNKELNSYCHNAIYVFIEKL